MKNKPVNEIKITLSALPENEAVARGCVSQFVSRADPTVTELADVRCAVSEAVTNCVVHAYRGEPGYIYINARLYGDGRLTVKVSDRGCGIPDVALAMTPLYTTDKEGYRRQSGMITINGKITEDRRVIIRIRDKGVGIEDVKQAMEPLFTTASDEERAGLGFAVMQSFCDRLKVKSKVGYGTDVFMEKYLIR